MSPFTHPSMLLFALAFGVFSAYSAHRKRRNPYLWFLIGFMFGIFGIMAIFFAPFQKKRKARRAPQKQEPIFTLQGPTNKFWYYLNLEGTQEGPMSHSAFVNAWKQGKLNPSTYIWHEDLTDWKQLKEVTVSSMG